MEVSEKGQDQVRNGIQSLKGILTEWHIKGKISRQDREEAFKQLGRIDMVCKDGKP